jgi:hypothetical protein
MSIVQAPIFKNVISVSPKTIAKKATGNVVSAMLKSGGKISMDGVKWIIKSLLNIKLVKSTISKMLKVCESSTLYKMLINIPIFGNVVKFTKEKLDVILDETIEIVESEVKTYRFNLIKGMPNTVSTFYNSLDSKTKTKFGKDFVIDWLTKTLHRLTSESLLQNFLTTEDIKSYVAANISDSNIA